MTDREKSFSLSVDGNVVLVSCLLVFVVSFFSTLANGGESPCNCECSLAMQRVTSTAAKRKKRKMQDACAQKRRNAGEREEIAPTRRVRTSYFFRLFLEERENKYTARVFF